MPRKKPSPPKRKLQNGIEVCDSNHLANLTIQTRCPKKWLFVDMETGMVWWKAHGAQTWRNIGYVDTASMASITVLPTANAGIPRFDFKES